MPCLQHNKLLSSCFRLLPLLCTYLTGQREDESPVFLPLFFPQGKVQPKALGIPRLPLLPAAVKPADRTEVNAAFKTLEMLAEITNIWNTEINSVDYQNAIHAVICSACPPSTGLTSENSRAGCRAGSFATPSPCRRCPTWLATPSQANSPRPFGSREHTVGCLTSSPAPGTSWWWEIPLQVLNKTTGDRKCWVLTLWPHNDDEQTRNTSESWINYRLKMCTDISKDSLGVGGVQPSVHSGCSKCKKVQKVQKYFFFFTFLDVSIQNFIKKFFLNCWGQVLDV